MMSARPIEGQREKADTSAWIAVAAGTIGSLMATLDTSIVNSALPIIQGEIGASGSEGTWISTAYLVAEIIMIPMAGWLEKSLGLRTLLLAASTIFTLCSIGCGLSSNLTEMVLGRIGQGFSGGAMIPTALSIVATRLPRSQRPVGTALFGMTAILGPVIGPVLGGWLTETLSWHYVFFINLPIGVGLLVLLIAGLPRDRRDANDVREPDYLGILGLILGLGCLTTVLEEGQRERWFESPLIIELSIASMLGFAILTAGQYVARRPVINLRILFQREFFGVFAMTLVLGAAVYGLLYMIPQFLTGVAGYDSLQSGSVAAISGIPTVVMMFVYPILVRKLDMRLAVAFGVLLYSGSCFLTSNLTSDATGTQFLLSQSLRGFAMFFSMLFLNQAATDAVEREYAEDASGLFNAARNLGGSFGLAAIATIQQQRVDLHYARLAESLSANSAAAQVTLSSRGVAGLSRLFESQATVMAYNDLYWLFGIVLLATVPLLFLLKSHTHAQTPAQETLP